jgi:predicted dienelactone hydrolase
MNFGISFLALILAATPCLAETTAGFSHSRDASVVERPLSLSIWYPSEEPASITVGANPIFEGTPTAPDAPFSKGTLPLVVLSHGGLRSAADSGAWLSASIARAGYVVVEVNAPRPNTASLALNEIWQRPQDVRRTIDFMLTDDIWGPRIDGSKVSVAGFALGATAALVSAGAEMDTARYMQSCVADGLMEGPDCEWFAATGVDPADTNPEVLGALTQDPRVTSVIAVNPEYLPALNIAAGDVDILRVELGDPDVSADNSHISKAVVISGASAFDAFAVCTVAGPDILSEEDGDPSLCGTSKKARQAIHRDISETIVLFLKGRGE